MNRSLETLFALALTVIAVCLPSMAMSLETDRQKPIEIFAGSGSGSFGDGTSILSGDVRIQQGTLLIEAEEAEIDKRDGKVRQIVFRGAPARLEQEIEAQGLVQAEANTITYLVGPGRVELAGGADVTHPQYQISGALLTYDLNRQHFEGTGADSGDGRINIRMDPEVVDSTPSNAEVNEDTEPDEPAAANGDSEAERDGPGRP